jgi:hypothetical protein
MLRGMEEVYDYRAINTYLDKGGALTLTMSDFLYISLPAQLINVKQLSL